MLIGHENCPATAETISAWQGPSWTITRCEHTHIEEVQADDGLGTGPIVADCCNCCGMIRNRSDYQ